MKIHLYRGVFFLLIALGGLPSLVLAQPTNCPPACGISFTVPSDPARPPEASPATLKAAEGSEIRFATDNGVQVIFLKETPFVDRNGNEVYRFTVSSGMGREWRVRTDGNACLEEPGCEYIVVDRATRSRPPLDPYIIIMR